MSQVIEILREQSRSYPEPGSSELRDNLILLLDQGTAFYESLLENLQQKYHFNLKDILNNASARKRCTTLPHLILEFFCDAVIRFFPQASFKSGEKVNACNFNLSQSFHLSWRYRTIPGTSDAWKQLWPG